MSHPSFINPICCIWHTHLWSVISPWSLDHWMIDTLLDNFIHRSKSPFPHPQVPKITQRPGNRLSVFIKFHVHCDVRLGGNIGICHMFISWWCLWRLISIGIYEKSLFYCSGSKKMHVEHPQKTLRFWDGFAFRHSTNDSFPSLQLADRLCSDVTHTHRHFDVCIAIAKPSVQRNMKRAYRSTTEVYNVA